MRHGDCDYLHHVTYEDSKRSIIRNRSLMAFAKEMHTSDGILATDDAPKGVWLGANTYNGKLPEISFFPNHCVAGSKNPRLLIPAAQILRNAKFYLLKGSLEERKNGPKTKVYIKIIVVRPSENNYAVTSWISKHLGSIDLIPLKENDNAFLFLFNSKWKVFDNFYAFREEPKYSPNRYVHLYVLGDIQLSGTEPWDYVTKKDPLMYRYFARSYSEPVTSAVSNVRNGLVTPNTEKIRPTLVMVGSNSLGLDKVQQTSRVLTPAVPTAKIANEARPAETTKKEVLGNTKAVRRKTASTPLPKPDQNKPVSQPPISAASTSAGMTQLVESVQRISLSAPRNRTLLTAKERELAQAKQSESSQATHVKTSKSAQKITAASVKSTPDASSRNSNDNRSNAPKSAK